MASSVSSRTKESILFRVFGALVLVGLLAILALGLRSAQARVERRAIGLAEKALWLYRLECGAFPPPGREADALENDKDNPYYAEFKRRWPNRKGLRDQWGRPWRISPGRHNPHLLDIYSVGPNGRDEQGRGDDISNWTP